MNSINLYRKNEYSNNLIPVDVYINGKKYKLSSNSSIEIETTDSPVEVYARYLWVGSKKIHLYGSNKTFQIDVKPYLPDSWMFLHVSLIVVLFLLYSYFEWEVLKYIFNVVGISFIAIMFYFISFGRNRYFKLAIDEKDRS